METFEVEMSPEQVNEYLALFPNLGKNAHVGAIAVRIVAQFFKSSYPDCVIDKGKHGADIFVSYEGRQESFEVKGTVSTDMAWEKIKVSSQPCYDSLVAGMRLIRVTGVGSLRVKLHFMKYGEDFTLMPEVRYQVKRLTQKDTA